MKYKPTTLNESNIYQLLSQLKEGAGNSNGMCIVIPEEEDEPRS